MICQHTNIWKQCHRCLVVFTLSESDTSVLLLGRPDMSCSNYLLHDVLKFPAHLLGNVPTSGKTSTIMPISWLSLRTICNKYHQLRRFKSSRMWHYHWARTSQHSFITLGITQPTIQPSSSGSRFDPDDEGATLLQHIRYCAYTTDNSASYPSWLIFSNTAVRTSNVTYHQLHSEKYDIIFHTAKIIDPTDLLHHINTQP
jgi:hypothetical protein